MEQVLLFLSKFRSQSFSLVLRSCTITVCPLMVVRTLPWTKLLGARYSSFQQDVFILEGSTWLILKLSEILSCDTSKTVKPSKPLDSSCTLIEVGRMSVFDNGRKWEALGLYCIWLLVVCTTLKSLINTEFSKSVVLKRLICNCDKSSGFLCFPTMTKKLPSSKGWRVEMSWYSIFPFIAGAVWLLMSIKCNDSVSRVR